MAYEMLPNWLKPGVKQWNKTMIELSNGCKVGAEATSGDSGRSFSINCLAGESIISIMDQQGNIKQITLEQAYEAYPCLIEQHVDNNFNDIKDLFEV